MTNFRQFWLKLLEAGEFTAVTTSASLSLAIALGVVNPAAAGVTVASLAFVGPGRKAIEFFTKSGIKNSVLKKL